MARITNVWGNIQPIFKDSMPVGVEILRQLLEKGIISGQEQTDVQNQPNRERKREELLQILKEKSPEIYYKFVGFLKDNHNGMYEKFLSLDPSLKEKLSASESSPDSKGIGARDFRDVARQLLYDDLRRLYLELDISTKQVEDAERIANSRNTETLAVAVLEWWKKTHPTEASRTRILTALEECALMEAKEILEELWA